MEVRSTEKVVHAVTPVPQLERRVTQVKHFLETLVARFSDEARFLTETQRELLIRLTGVDGELSGAKPDGHGA